ncbi:MAG: PH domain-containing protein [Synergistes sp.]|nr:PH domain-containing protein [Synergistes sp.]
MWKKYSSALILTPDSLFCKKGLVRVNRTEVALKYIQSVEIKQSIAERLLFVGTIFAGTAATQCYGISFSGAPSPQRIAEKIRRYSRMQGR